MSYTARTTGYEYFAFCFTFYFEGKAYSGLA